jgi:hypothetical protein
MGAQDSGRQQVLLGQITFAKRIQNTELLAPLIDLPQRKPVLAVRMYLIDLGKSGQSGFTITEPL